MEGGLRPMKEDEKLALDEARRIAQHEAVKGEVREKVHGEIARNAAVVTPGERAREEALADSLKRKAVAEVATTEAELDRGKTFARVSQVVDYLFYLVYGIIGLEIILEALGARESAGFKRFIDAIATPFLAPFEGLMPDPGAGRFRFMLSYVIALGVYILLHLAVNGLLRLFVHHKTEV
jgi:uncharacterized protein YggT (Ycf19 family)